MGTAQFVQRVRVVLVGLHCHGAGVSLTLCRVFLLFGLPIVFGLIAAPALILWWNGQERDIVLLYRNIYAAGDVAGPYQFTHVAGHQAWFAAINALFGDLKRFKADYSVIPWATFTDPEVARVGLSEAEAKEKKIPHEVTRFGIDDLDRAIADGSARGFVKVLTVPGKDRILGATIVGEHAGDLLAEFVFAMKHGHGLGKILGTIHTYPTMSEANKYAAGEWKRNHQPAKLLEWVAKYHAWRRG